MKLLLPNNIFARLFLKSLPEALKGNVAFAPSSELSLKLSQDEADIALIPSLDLIKHKDFFISGRNAISFDGNLSSAFLYFQPDKENLSDIYFAGDVSVNELLLSEILFREKYSLDIKLHLSTGALNLSERNYMIVGDANYKDSMLDHQFSFADELSNMLELPYVNFVLASRQQESISSFCDGLENLDMNIEDNAEQMISGFHLEERTAEFVRNNLNSVYFEITEPEQEGLLELLKLPYYHGRMDDIIEPKLV